MATAEKGQNRRQELGDKEQHLHHCVGVKNNGKYAIWALGTRVTLEA